MAGQQSLKKYDRESLFNKHNKSLLNQVDLWYLNDKFAISTEFEEEKVLYDYLMREVYATTNCETIDFLNKKLRGALVDDNIDIVNLQSMQIKYRDINNYYYTAPKWEPNVEW